MDLVEELIQDVAQTVNGQLRLLMEMKKLT